MMICDTLPCAVSDESPTNSGAPRAGGRLAGRRGGDLPLVRLASRSPRRRLLLDEAGVRHEVIESGIDDAHLSPGRVSPAEWVAALAYLKAAAGVRNGGVGDEADGSVVLGADTVVVHRGAIIGQPRDAADAERIVRLLADDEHDVLTGVAIIDARTCRRELLVDRARVRVGPLGEDQIASYIASGEWRGKAGAYNLSERLAAGWPIRFEGDAGTIMGLPVRRLVPVLASYGAA